MIKIKFNKKKVIPNPIEYIKIFLSIIFIVYFFKLLIIKLFPQILELSDCWALAIWVMMIIWFKDLIEIQFKGRDYF